MTKTYLPHGADTDRLCSWRVKKAGREDRRKAYRRAKKRCERQAMQEAELEAAHHETMLSEAYADFYDHNPGFPLAGFADWDDHDGGEYDDYYGGEWSGDNYIEPDDYYEREPDPLEEDGSYDDYYDPYFSSSHDDFYGERFA